MVEETEREVLVHLLFVDASRESRVLEDRLDLGREEHPITVLGVVHGLDAEVVAGEHDPRGLAAEVEQGEAPHAVEAVEAVGVPLRVGVEHDFGVARGVELVAGGLELRPQLAEVVDLAVVRDVDEAVVGAHRLVAAGEVDDAQAAEAEARVVGVEQAEVVGAPVHLGRRHRVEQRAVSRTPEAADTAHRRPRLGGGYTVRR